MKSIKIHLLLYTQYYKRIFDHIIFFLIIISLPITASARENCKNDSIKSQDIINCLMVDYEKSDKILNQLYWNIIHKLPISEQRNLKRDQIKWIKSKDKCNKYYVNGAEGRFHAISCRTHKTDERIQYLKTIRQHKY